MTSILRRDTQRRQQYEGRGRDESDAATNQRPKIACSHQKLGGRHKTDAPSEPLEGTNTLTSDFWPPEM